MSEAKRGWQAAVRESLRVSESGKGEWVLRASGPDSDLGQVLPKLVPNPNPLQVLFKNPDLALLLIGSGNNCHPY